MSEINRPEDVEAVKALVATLDAEAIAAKSNALTGGCLRAEDAAELVILTALSAIRAPGFETIVAGIRAVFFAGELRLSFDAELARLTLTPPTI